MEERVGEAFEFDEQLTVVGSKLKPGQSAPPWTLDRFDGTAIRSVSLADSQGRVRLLNIINSVDTPVCHAETQRWEQLKAELPSDTAIYTISMDLPFAQSRWQIVENIDHPLLSSHRSTNFGEEYGVLLKEWRLLQRAVIVIDPADRVVYAEYVPDQMQEPDYAAAVDAIRSAVNA